MKKIKNKILSIVLTCAMMVSLFVCMAPMNVQAIEATYTITLNKTNYPAGDCIAWGDDVNGEQQYLRNGSSIEIPVDGSITVIANNAFTVIAEGATVGELQEGGEGGYFLEITNFTADTTVIVNKEYSYPLGTIADLGDDSITIDANNLCHFNVPDDGDDYIYLASVVPVSYLGAMTGADYVEMCEKGVGKPILAAADILYIDDSDYNKELCENEMTIYFTNADGIERSMLEDIPVTEESVAFIYKFHKDNMLSEEYVDATKNPYLTNMAANINIYAVYGVHAEILTPSGSTSGGATFIDKVDVQIDWDKIPLLEEGMTEVPMFEEIPGTVTVTGAESSYADWAVKVDNSFKITPEDSYYNEILAMEKIEVERIFSGTGEDFIKFYNGRIDEYIEVFSGMAPIRIVLGNPFYKINDQDTYSMYAAMYAEYGYTFGETTGKEYQGELTSNLDITCQFVDANGEGLVVFYKLGTLDEIEDEKNGTDKEPIKESGEVEKDADVAEDAPIDEATLDNSKEDLLKADNIFTETEKQAITNGADAKVWLEINKVSDIAQADKNKIEEEAAKIMGEELNITYFDAKLFKQVGTNPKAPISEPGIAIKVTITIPKELLNTDGTINREYMILRLHEGQAKADVIKGTFNATTGEFTFETDKFSTYAIVYKDTLSNVNDSTTGYNNPLVYVAIVALISGLGIVLSASKRKAVSKGI